MYLLDTSFFTISALVALVPIPLPLICSLKSSSSMSCPAFSMARIKEPELYRFGADVVPSLILYSLTGSFIPFFNDEIALICSSVNATSFFWPPIPVTFKYPGSFNILKFAKNASPLVCVSNLIFKYTAGGIKMLRNLLAITS